MKNEWNVLWIDTSHTAPRDVRHISAPTAPPLKRRCGTRILRNPVCSLSISLLLLFLPSQHSSPSVHPIRSLYLLAALFDFIYLFTLQKEFQRLLCAILPLPGNATTMIVCLLGRIPLYFLTFLRTAWLQLISVLPFEHEYRCLLSYILPFAAIYSGIKEQSEAMPVRVDGRREAVYAARCI